MAFLPPPATPVATRSPSWKDHLPVQPQQDAMHRDQHSYSCNPPCLHTSTSFSLRMTSLQASSSCSDHHPVHAEGPPPYPHQAAAAASRISHTRGGGGRGQKRRKLHRFVRDRLWLPKKLDKYLEEKWQLTNDDAIQTEGEGRGGLASSSAAAAVSINRKQQLKEGNRENPLAPIYIIDELLRADEMDMLNQEAQQAAPEVRKDR